MIHKAIIITTTAERLIEIHQMAGMCFPRVSDMCCNSFLVPSPFSIDNLTKSKWDQLRNKFVAYLNTFRDNDGKSTVDWVEVQYGNDEIGTMVTRSGDWS